MPCGVFLGGPPRRWHFLRVLKNKEELFLQIKEWVSERKDISGRRTQLAPKFVETNFFCPTLSGRFSSEMLCMELATGPQKNFRL